MDGEHHVSVHVDRYEQTKNIRTARLRLYTRKVLICNLYQMFFFKYFKDVFRFSSSLDPCHSQSNPSPPQLQSGLFVAGKNRGTWRRSNFSWILVAKFLTAKVDGG